MRWRGARTERRPTGTGRPEDSRFPGLADILNRLEPYAIAEADRAGLGRSVTGRSIVRRRLLDGWVEEATWTFAGGKVTKLEDGEFVVEKG